MSSRRNEPESSSSPQAATAPSSTATNSGMTRMSDGTAGRRANGTAGQRLPPGAGDSEPCREGQGSRPQPVASSDYLDPHGITALMRVALSRSSLPKAAVSFLPVWALIWPMKSDRAPHAAAALLLARARWASPSVESRPVRSPDGALDVVTAEMSSWGCSAAPLTWTENCAGPERFPDESVARQCTVASPIANSPCGGSHVVTGLGSTASVAVAVKATAAPAGLVALTLIVPAGTSSAGGVVSTTWTMNDRASVWPAPSEVWHETVVSPIGSVLPGGDEQASVAGVPSGSVAV